MIYIVYDEETGKVNDIAYSELNMIKEGLSYLEITEEAWTNAQGKDKKVVNGQFVYEDFPPTLEDYDKALEEHLKAERIARGYTTREPSEYKGSSIERWNQDAEDWILHRDEVMMYGLQIENDYKEGKPIPTLDQFKANLPKITWTIK